MSFTHVMLDLETLATSSDAVVVSIGAVFFDPRSDKLGAEFYRICDDLNAQQNVGRKIDARTVAWWMRQTEAAQRVLTAPSPAFSVGTAEALDEFWEFLEDCDLSLELWGNGADFDNIILGSLFEDMGLKKPWSYGQNRCFRTMKNLALNKSFIGPIREGTHHNALDDAKHQARYLQAIYKALKL